MKNFFNRREEEIEEILEEDDLDIINLDETAGWSKLEIAEELAKRQAENLMEELGDELAILDVVEDDIEIEELPKRSKAVEEDDEDIQYITEDEDNEDIQYITEDEDIEYITEEEDDLEYMSDDEDEEEEDDEEEYEYEESPILAFFSGIGEWFSHWTVLDKVVAVTGVLVLAVAILTVGVFAGKRGVDKQVAAFAPVGEQLETVGVVGSDKLLAVADAKKAMLEAAKLEAELNQEYEENELSKEVKVIMKMTSVQKDLKIKFVNKKTGKLVGNIPFEVEITDSEKKTYSKIDEDQDGIIYLTKIPHGDYTVAMVELEGLEGYSFSTSKERIKVKENIAYEKIDVTEEIKDQSEVDVSKEDTAQKLETEATLTDTVEWVKSEKKEATSQETYTKVSKDTIADPSLSASLKLDLGIIRMMQQSILATGEVNTPQPRTVETITLSTAAVSLKVGESTTVTATVSPEASVTWTSGNSEIATVENGTITAKGEGETAITVATANQATATVKVTVTKAEETTPPPSQTVAVTGVTVSPTTATIKVEETTKLTATVTPDNATNKKVTWESSDTNIATVSEDGTVTGKGAGDATITAKTEDGSFTESCAVIVEAKAPETVAVTGVKLNKDKTTLKVGISETLGATVEPSNAANTEVEWSSEKPEVATVDQKGVVTAKAVGTTKITVKTKDGGKTAVCEVTVTAADAENKITLDKTSASMKTGETLTLKATVTPSDAKVVWKSSDEKIVKVDGNGKVEALAEGKATISVNIDGKVDIIAKCEITVSKAYDPKTDTTKLLRDKSGAQMYILKDGKYIEAKVADYWKYDTFYKKETVAQYTYTGWQNIDGKTYFFDKNGNKVTGEQVIQGAKHTFNSDGSLNTGSGILGIDVSTWNGNIDWNKVKNSGVSYVIIRTGFRGSTQGSLVEDNKFRQNIKGATNAGLKVGVYFFSQAVNEVEAVEEASMVLSQVKGYKLTYPVFIDVEPSGGRADKLSSGDRTKVINAFCQTIQNGGLRAGIYANKTWLSQKMNVSALSGYKIWLAQYNSTVTYGGRYDMWQYSDKGSIAGINGKVDMNLSYLSY